MPQVSSSGTLQFTPAPNAVGEAMITLRARDTGSSAPPNVNTSADQTFFITVAPVNDAPQFLKGPNQATNEDAGLQSITGWATNILPGPTSAIDEAGQSLQFVISVTTTGNLAFASGPSIDPVTGTLSYRPQPNTNGTATVSVTLQDSGDATPPSDNTSPTETFSITVNAINDAPEFIPGPHVTVDEDAGLVTVPAWATGIRPGPLTATDENSQTLDFIESTLSFSNNLSFTILPSVDPVTGNLSFQTTPNRSGVATISVRLRDSGFSATPHDNESDAFTLTISVNAVNDPPVFSVGTNQQVGEDSGAQTVFGFVSNIRPGPSTADDEVNQSVSFTTVNDNNNLFSAQPSISANGTLTYTAASNANGVAVVTVTATDSGSGVAPNQNSSSRQFTITVDAVNDAPTLNVPVAQSANEDVSLAIPGVSIADLDAAEGTGQVEVQFRVTNGSISLNTNVPNGVLASQVSNNSTSTVTVRATPGQINATLANGTGLNYRSALNFNGQDQLTINVDDLGNTGSPGARSVSRTVQITVNAVNDPPFVANPVADLVVDEDAAPTLIELFPQVFNDPDVLTSGDRLTLQVVGNTNLNLVDATVSGTVLTLALLPDAFGQADIIVQATDGSGLFVQDTFRLTVNARNDAPRLTNDAVTVNSGVATVIPVLNNDVDVDSVFNPASLAIISAPTNGTAVANANGTVTYTSTVGFSGTVTFTYVVSDDLGATSQPATVTVTVNRPPVANNDAVTTDQGVAVAVQLLANDTDADGTLVTSSVAIVQQPANGTVLVNSSGVATYTPNVDFSGTDTFRYTVRDNNSAVSNAATVTITVNPVRPWQNQTNPRDVNNDGFVSPIDALLIINRINTQGSGPLPPPNGSAPPPFYDSNGDNQISPIDALLVINFLNNPTAEGESVLADTTNVGWVTTQPIDEVVDKGALTTTFAPGFRELRIPRNGAGLLSWGSSDWESLSEEQEADDDLLVHSVIAGYRDDIISPQALADVSFADSELDAVVDQIAGASRPTSFDELTDAALAELLEQEIFRG